MEFEYDPAKGESNFRKHKIDFEDAQRLWDGVVVEAPARTVDGESRMVAFGMIDGKHWTVVFTNRNGRKRIISARRSRDKEVRFYDDYADQD